jgi:DNA recombination protein RmuC
MSEVLTLSIAAFAALITAGIVWAILSQRTVRMVEAAKADGIAKLAAADAREEALAEVKGTMRKQMQDAFELAAADAFKIAVKNADGEKEKSFSIATDALSKSMSEYIKALQETEKADIKRAAELSKEVGSVSKLGMELAQETRDLTRALKGDSQAQGAWGEVVVENLLQSMGFTEGRDYSKQFSETAVDKTRKRTDFVLNLPDNRQVVIDSKVSLTAYEAYVNAEDDDTAEVALKAHCDSIKKHAKDLASKNYEHMESINTLDFVLMVVPLESAFITAMRAEPELYQDLTESRRVKVVSGSTIMTALLLIQEIWKRENQSQNQIELVKRAGFLHDKVVLFLESFTEVGFEINQARDAFVTARKQLISGDGNVIRQTEMLSELGAKTGKELRKKSGVRLLAEEAEINHNQGHSAPEMVLVEAEEEE